jgi:hypothetical protein
MIPVSDDKFTTKRENHPHLADVGWNWLDNWEQVRKSGLPSGGEGGDGNNTRKL